VGRPKNEVLHQRRVKFGRFYLYMKEGLEAIGLLIFANAFLLSRGD
jgi:hypothetical protein